MNKSKSGSEREQKYTQENAHSGQSLPFSGMLFLKGIKYFIVLIADKMISRKRGGVG